MLNVERIDHLNMEVHSLEETKAFYEKVFGFEVLESGVSPMGRDYMIIGKSGIGALCIYEVKNKKDAELFEFLTINHWGFHVKNFEEAQAFCDANNIPYQYGGVVEQGKSRSLYIDDPNGYEIEVTEKLAGGL